MVFSFQVQFLRELKTLNKLTKERLTICYKISKPALQGC